MDLTIICPTYNEINFIDTLITKLCADDGLKKEVLIVDGGSNDGTRGRVLKWIQLYPNLQLLDNKNRDATHAFNIGYKHSTGKCIAFVGAHAEYAKNYFRNALGYLNRNKCDVVGGCLHQQGKTRM